MSWFCPCTLLTKREATLSYFCSHLQRQNYDTLQNVSHPVYLQCAHRLSHRLLVRKRTPTKHMPRRPVAGPSGYMATSGEQYGKAATDGNPLALLFVSSYCNCTYRADSSSPVIRIIRHKSSTFTAHLFPSCPSRCPLPYQPAYNTVCQFDPADGLAKCCLWTGS